MVKRIWSPWRMEYIRGERRGGCIFCDKVKEERDEENLILLRGQQCFVMLNRFPYTNGHLMIAPYAHVDMPNKLPLEAQVEMMRLVCICIEVLQEAMHPDGFKLTLHCFPASPRFSFGNSLCLFASHNFPCSPGKEFCQVSVPSVWNSPSRTRSISKQLF